MYWKLTLRKNLFVAPEHLGPAVNERLQQLLREQVEAKHLPGQGLVVAVIDIKNLRDLHGRVLDTGKVLFEVEYEAVVWRTFRGDVRDGYVTEVTAEGIVVDVGAVNVFVSDYLMPPGMEFVPGASGDAAKFATPDDAIVLAAGAMVRVGIVQETAKNERIGALGTIQGEGLGPRF